MKKKRTPFAAVKQESFSVNSDGLVVTVNNKLDCIIVRIQLIGGSELIDSVQETRLFSLKREAAIHCSKFLVSARSCSYLLLEGESKHFRSFADLLEVVVGCILCNGDNLCHDYFLSPMLFLLMKDRHRCQISNLFFCRDYYPHKIKPINRSIGFNNIYFYHNYNMYLSTILDTVLVFSILSNKIL